MKKTTLVLAGLAALGAGLAGAGIVSAHGMWGGGFGAVSSEEAATRQETMFLHQAEMLGVSVEEVKNAWAEGKNMRELAEEKGISEDVLQQRRQDRHQEMMSEHLNLMVEQGVVTREQAEAHAAFMEQKGEHMGRGMRGHHGFNQQW